MNPAQCKIEVGARSETGYIRHENQDRMSGAEVSLGQLYIIADGMGGHKGGALAAELTILGLQRQIAAASPDEPVEEMMRTVFNKVNHDVHRKAHSDNFATEGMGSTAVLLLISNGIARLAHVGDSRAYRYRRQQLKQLTKDHTIVQKMVDNGMLTREEADKHPDASVLERAIGSKPTVDVEISPEWKVHDGDAILLCSDGLSGYVSDHEIADILRSPATVQEIPERLVEMALQKGGQDNVTVQFIQCGARKEALAKSKNTKKLPVMNLANPQGTPKKTIFVLFLVGAICVGIVSYFNIKFTSTQDQMSRLHPITKITGKKLEEQLRTAAIHIEQLRSKLAELKEDAKSSSVTYNKKIKTANISRNKAVKRANDLAETLNATTVAKDKFENYAWELEQQLKDAKAEIAEAKNEAADLQVQLDAAVQELSMLKPKQAEESGTQQ